MGKAGFSRGLIRLGFAGAAAMVPLWPPHGRSSDASLPLARWGGSTDASACLPSRPLMPVEIEVEWTDGSLLVRGDGAMPRSSASSRLFNGEPSGSLSGDAGRLLLGIRCR
ncbi:hypothetical protein BC629DRAFT_1562207, partial [Irpex lacteus]